MSTIGNLYGVTVKAETNPGTCRLARYELCRFCCWSGSVNPGQIFLQPASPAHMGAAVFAFRASLERAVRLDGYRRMASLAIGGIPRQSYRALALCRATRIERLMELALLCLAHRRVCICRHRVALGPYCCHSRLFLARASSRWRSPHSVLAMGRFRSRTQLLCMAVQSPGSRLVALTSQLSGRFRALRSGASHLRRARCTWVSSI